MNKAEVYRKDAQKISKLADRHKSSPDRFIRSLDALFREMCKEMAEKREPLGKLA